MLKRIRPLMEPPVGGREISLESPFAGYSEVSAKAWEGEGEISS